MFTKQNRAFDIGVKIAVNLFQLETLCMAVCYSTLVFFLTDQVVHRIADFDVPFFS